ncbi:SDR family oxidoreductase [Nocardioides stalactiti]|uniref:SDR family oxidoreductase n=1 Tax=Nocardioides stalactiti TaxID=2755356 RepID=UPI001600DBC7|nr:SDR family oxidoreductase [Nocardioides stalactiti]
MSNLLNDRVAVITGAGRGLGRAHALEFAAHGAAVVVNDLASGGEDPAADVVAEIRTAGGRAVAASCDVTDEDGVAHLLATAVDEFGDVHAVVNNAGILRDHMLVNMTVDEWDAVIAVHLRGTFLLTRAAARHWRTAHKSGEPVSGRIVNTTSPAGLFGNIGQANYSAAKAGIAAFTITVAEELRRYGVTVNALSPNARTRMTATLFADTMTAREGEFDVMDPANASPLLAWLCSEEAGDVTGRTFTVLGSKVFVNEGWHEGVVTDLGRRWSTDDVAHELTDLLERARPAMPVLGTADSGIVPTSQSVVSEFAGDQRRPLERTGAS